MRVEHIPKPFMNWAVVGPTKCGKTQLVTQVLEMLILLRYFEPKNIHVFCPTAKYQDAWKKFKGIHIYPSGDAAIMQKIQADADWVYQNDGPHRVPNILMICDDLYSQNKSNFMRSDIVVEIATHGRHLNISSIHITQAFYGLAKGLRSNLTHMSLFRPHTTSEVEDFLLNIVFRDERKTIIQRAREVWKTPYNFIQINMEEILRPLKFREGFDKPLFGEYDMSKKDAFEESSCDEEYDSSDDESEEPVVPPPKRKKIEDDTADKVIGFTK